ncbi:MAG TPA: hypothetical protein VLV83_17805 [Acidobacteriota bacterium]|nr:hypothetical protein [Acidobacteriota bacterium]
MNRLKLLSIAAILLLLTAPMAMAQVGDGYGPDRNSTYPQEVQSKNTPAGTVVEPGSQLIFLLDTGIRPSEIDPNADPVATISANFGITAPAWTNFIAITNTNPTDAVTVHFRYFNENCEDVLDFLVLLTCNDTMLVNAFDFTIPGSNVNVSERFFGTAPNRIAGLPTGTFGEGRFLLFVTASGDAGDDSGESGNDTSPAGDRGDFDDPEDLDVFADWLYPNELTPEDLIEDCPGIDPTKIGVQPGINDNNLNIFNASAISFNYITGFHTIAVARSGGQASFGVNAWTRPAINASKDLDLEDTSEQPDQDPDFTPQDVVGDAPTAINPQPSKSPNGVFDFFDLYNINDDGMDGDGPLAPKRVILAGSEEIWLTLFRSDGLLLPANYFYLRQDAHGGNTIETNCEGFTPLQPRCDQSNPFVQDPVRGGALGWTLFPESGVPPEDQFLYFASFKDDYNGSNNPNNGALQIRSDNSYRLDPAATYYQLVVFNNNEVPLEVVQELPPISPPPPFQPLNITLAVKCINAFRFEIAVIPAGDRVTGGSGTDFVFVENFQTFSVEDLYSLDGQGLIQDFLSAPVPVGDELGPGWVRFDRIVTRDFFYDAADPAFATAVSYDGERGTYVTIAQSSLFVDAFGASWWVPQSATDAFIEEN